MIAENVARKMDDKGRITFPKGLRDRLQLDGCDLELYTDVIDGAQCIILKKENRLKADLEKYGEIFYKILEVDFKDDSYATIISDDCGPGKFSEYIKEFGEKFVHPDDRKNFLGYQDRRCTFYRRKIGDEWIPVCLEMVPLGEKYLLTVRNIDGYVEAFREQIKTW